jgi:hypothetical protein
MLASFAPGASVDEKIAAMNRDGAVYSGYRYARGLDEVDGGELPFRRERVTV